MEQSSVYNDENFSSWKRHLDIVTERARIKMEELNVDSLVALSAENYYYLAGFPSYFLYGRRQAGLAMAVMFRNPNKKTVLILNEFEAASLPKELMKRNEVRTYPIWVDVDDPYNIKGEKYQNKRPVSFQIDDIFKMLNSALLDGDVEKERIATELQIMQYPAWESLHKNTKNLEFVEAAELFQELRSIKTSWEINLLRRTAFLAEKGISESIKIAKTGITAADLGAKFKTTIMSDPDCISARLHIISIGGDFAPRRMLSTYQGEEGDIVKFDVGADIAGYGSDLARTFVLGQAKDEVKKIYNALRTGHDRLLEIVGPGIQMNKVFEEVMGVIKKSGLKSYNRGHLGHSVGMVIEEPPFVSPSETTTFKPGMVVCLETPYYAYGVGAIMIENMLLITENGYEDFNKLSRDLISL